MNWEGCPPGFTRIYLDNNQITEINWGGCPDSLTTIYLNINRITNIDWEFCPVGLTRIYFSNNQITEMNWEGCPPGLTTIYLRDNKITEMNWNGCRNDLIDSIYPFTKKYLEYKKTDAFVPYLPEVSKLKKEIHYELNSIWWKCPDGILFKEDIQNLINSGLFET
jgi:hypothetical protein